MAAKTSTLKCSACSGGLKQQAEILRGTGYGSNLLVCVRCGGLHGTMYRGEAAHLVGLGRPMLAEATSPDALRYFDLTVLGSAGVSRVHGWYDVRERRVVQYG
jgi:hypothetical protein